MPTLDGVNVKRLDHPEGPGVLLDASEILLTLASYIEGSHPSSAVWLRELADYPSMPDLAISDKTLFGLSEEEWQAHSPHARGELPLPSEKEWALHVAFYRLTVAQRDRAWRRILELESAYKQIAREAADLLGERAPGAAAMFDQAAEEGP